MPLELVKLNSNNLLDPDINAYDFLIDVERMAQIEDEFFFATNDVNALFEYMKSADNAYYQTMVSSADGLQKQFENVIGNASPEGWDYFAIESSMYWELVSGLSNAAYEYLKAGADGVKGIYDTKGAALSGLVPEGFSWLAKGDGKFFLYGGEGLQLLTNAYENGVSLIGNYIKLFETSDLVTISQLNAESMTLCIKITDDLSQLFELLSNEGMPDSVQESLGAFKFLGAVINLAQWVEELVNIDSVADNSSSLSPLSNKFLSQAYWINFTEGADILKDMAGAIVDMFVNNPQAAAQVALCTELGVTLTDLGAVAFKNGWQTDVIKFNNYENIAPVVENYQQNLNTWLAHADSLSGGTSGLPHSK